MTGPPAPQPDEQRPAGSVCNTAGSQLLIDEFLPTYDAGVVHADVFPAPPAQCYLAARELDLFRTPLIRTLIGIRALPQRAASTLRKREATCAHDTSSRTFRFSDMVDLGWISLGETPGVELVLGQVGRPWKGITVSPHLPTTPEQFKRFKEPGFAKIAASIRVDPYGNHSSILTMATRVALTDDASRRRFRRYWLIIGPFSSLIRRTALRLLATELRRPTPARPDDGSVG